MPRRIKWQVVAGLKTLNFWILVQQKVLQLCAAIDCLLSIARNTVWAINYTIKKMLLFAAIFLR
jgi:hypothetical protein